MFLIVYNVLYNTEYNPALRSKLKTIFSRLLSKSKNNRRRKLQTPLTAQVHLKQCKRIYRRITLCNKTPCELISEQGKNELNLK